jgi:hypothetical protein
MTRREAIPYMLDKGAYNKNHEIKYGFRSKVFINDFGRVVQIWQDGATTSVGVVYSSSLYNDGWEPWEDPIEYVDGFTALKAMAENDGEIWIWDLDMVRYRITARLQFLDDIGWRDSLISAEMLFDKLWHKYIPKENK